MWSLRRQKGDDETSLSSEMIYDESGNMTVFGMCAFLVILYVAGMSVDVMLYETERAKLQATVDSAALAAADLQNPVDPNQIVTEYFEAAGMAKYLNGVNVM